MCETAQQLADGWNKLKKVSKSYIVQQPQFGEQVLVEDYLDGKFQKWNSNSGWISHDSIDSSVQAFCHFTYHYTDRNFLFCDAQGIVCFMLLYYICLSLQNKICFVFHLVFFCGDRCKNR